MDDTHQIATGGVERFGSANIHSAIILFMKNSNIILAVILKKKEKKTIRGMNICLTKLQHTLPSICFK